jgi:hypothetical protein
MEPVQIIRDLCRQYGVSEEFGRRLIPLLERARSAAPEMRQRILDLVRRSFVEEARRARDRRELALPEPELRVLRTVASILHGWNPPTWLEHWGEKRPRPS